MRVCSHRNTTDNAGRSHHALDFEAVDDAYFDTLRQLPYRDRYRKIRPTLRAFLAVLLHESGHMKRLFAYDSGLKEELHATVKKLAGMPWEAADSAHIVALANEPDMVILEAAEMRGALPRLKKLVYEDLAQSEKAGVFRDFVGTVLNPRTGRVEKQLTPHHVEPIGGY